MVEIKAIIRREKVCEVKKELKKVGVHGFTHWNVMGHGKQNGLLINGMQYDALPKEFVYIVAEDRLKTAIVTTIIKIARTIESGKAGDGRIFVSYIDEGYTISQSVL